MLHKFYKFAEEPFGVTPDPRFLYFGTQHREALASLVYGTESNRGFLALIAKPGMGKTSLLYRYLEGLCGKARTAFVFRTDCDSREFIRHVLLDLGVDVTGKDLPTMHDALNQVLTEEIRAGRRFVLVIDEAQNLEEDVLESIRLLSNFETPWMKLMQIVIAGQPGLAEKLSRPSMVQLRQRISLIIRIAPLNREEINAYIDHRLSVAGCKDSGLFTAEARNLIAEHSEGIPRKINNICFNAMSLASALKYKIVDRANVLEVLADLDLNTLIEKPPAVTEALTEGPVPVSSAPQLLMERKMTWFQKWAPKLAVGAALALVVVTGVKKGEEPAVSHAERVDSQAMPSLPFSPQIPQNVVKPRAPRKEQRPDSIRSVGGQTLSQISPKVLGRHDRQNLEEITNFNSWLRDSTYPRAGQSFLMPFAERLPTGGLNLAPEGLSSTPQEVGKE